MKKIYIAVLSLFALNANALERYTIANLVDKINPAVVYIKAVEDKAVKENTKANPFSKKDKQAALDNHKKQVSSGIKSKNNYNIGSGVIISKEGLVITNYHVVEIADKITVTTSNNKFYDAKIIGFDQKSDLALLKIDSKDNTHFTFAKFADSNNARIGELVFAIGNPYGLEGTVSTGIISGRNRNIGTNIYDDFLQTDASINPGNSGGPLFNLDGEIVGINTAIFSQTGGSDGIGFAIPSNTVDLIVTQLKQTGKVVRGWLGIQAQIIDESIATALKLESTNGVLVADVTANSPAKLAGIKSGDVILKYNDKQIKNLFDLPKMVAETAINDEAKITLLRKGQQLVVNAKIISTEQGAAVEVAQEDGITVKQLKVLGFYITDLTEEVKKELKITATKGVLVTNVDKSFKRFNLVKGDIILQVDQKNVNSIQEVKHFVDNSTKPSLLLFINRKGNNIFSVIEK